MGNSSASLSKSERLPTRASVYPIQKLPMPEKEELEKRFNRVLTSMDLPPDKAKQLRSYDDDKKWDLICNQEQVSAKEPPEIYLNKLRVYLDPSHSSKNRKVVGQSSSTQTLKDLEISLRTNNIEWVRLFLDEAHNGLDILVEYLSVTQDHMRWQQMEEAISGEQSNGGRQSSRRRSAERPVSTLSGYGDQPQNNGSSFLSTRPSFSSSSRRKRLTLSNVRHTNSKLNFGEATDDIHVCIMCLRAIMNHQYGFNLVFAHSMAINCIALSLNHKSFRTKTLVLELLAAVCLVSGGHQIILHAFDNFKTVCGETHRFSTMMSYFMNDEFNIDFMVACMQFINIVVHSVEDMNFRVHLQHEFSLLGLDEFLEKLRHTESDRLPIQVNAYLDNTIDVQILLEDSDIKASALLEAQELQEELSHANERIQEIEETAIQKISELKRNLNDMIQERDRLKEDLEAKEVLLLRRTGGDGAASSFTTSSGSGELMPLRSNNADGASSDHLPIPTFIPPPPPQPMFDAPAPPPPPPPPGGSSFVPPPPPPGFGMPPLPGLALTIKRTIQPKVRLPVLNWVAMKPNQVKGTMFADLDDERLYKIIDFNKFEELFKLGNLSLDDDLTDSQTFKPTKKIETVSLLEPNRMRNVAITRRKIEVQDDDIVRAINSLDLKTLSLDRVEILLRISPNEQELKLFKEYERDRKPVDLLSEEDRFMLNLMRVERLNQKLHIMSFIGNFFETYDHLSPQLLAVISASISVKNSTKMKRLIEIILAFGNYMNSFKRGAVYGFKLQSLDMLVDTKSNDKKISLLHFIVKTVQEKFPDVGNFEAELKNIEKASTVSLENILTDLTDLEKGMEMTRKEYEARKERDPPVILRDFLANSEDKIKQLKADCKAAQEKYSLAVEYYGENAKTLAPNTFFALFLRFMKAYKQAEIDLEMLRKAEAAQLVIRESVRENKKGNQKHSQAAVVGELKQKQQLRQINEKKVYEVYDGALEDILLGLKNEPYRPDGARRSTRRCAGDVIIKSSPAGVPL